MVCGILIARPAEDSKVTISTESVSEISGEADGNAAAAQAPIQAGVGMGGTFAKEFGLAFVPKSPFIYGFKLKECFFKKGSGSSKAHYKNAKIHTRIKDGESESLPPTKRQTPISIYQASTPFLDPTRSRGAFSHPSDLALSSRPMHPKTQLQCKEILASPILPHGFVVTGLSAGCFRLSGIRRRCTRTLGLQLLE
jgi:hypothetical protein